MPESSHVCNTYGNKMHIGTNTVNSVDGHGGHQPTQSKATKARMKAFDMVVASTNFTNAGYLVQMTGLGQGTQNGQRTGDVITVRKFTLNYRIYSQNSDAFNTCRILVFRWKPNSTLVSPTLASVTNGTSITSSMWMYDWQYSSQFVILYDRIHFLAGTATAPDVSGTQGASFEIPLNLRLEYTGTGSTDHSNGLYLLAMSESAVPPHPAIEWMSRIQYAEN